MVVTVAVNLNHTGMQYMHVSINHALVWSELGARVQLSKDRLVCCAGRFVVTL